MNKNHFLSKNKNVSISLTSRNTSTNYTDNLNAPNYTKPYFLHQKQKTNSLEELTKKFTSYVLKLNSNTIDLNDFIKKYKVKKRRIYDVTNVLQGKTLFLFIYK